MLIIERYSNPTRYDLAPYGSIYKHDDKLFIQISKDPESSEWLPLGEFFEKIYTSSLNDDFLKECLNTYESKNI